MGWGTDFDIDIYLNRLIFLHINEVRDAIQDSRDEIEEYEKTLLMYAVANPKDIIPEDWKEESVNFIRREVGNTLKDLRDEINHLKDLNYYLQFLEKNNITIIKNNE